MKPTFEFIKGKVGSYGQCIYQKSGYSLEYKIEPSFIFAKKADTLASVIEKRVGIVESERRYLVICDTLTLVFAGHEKKLYSLDAYSNIDLWQAKDDLGVPEIKSAGALILSNAFEEERFRISSSPKYQFNSKSKILRICLDNVIASNYYEVAKDIVVGLKNNDVIDIFLLNLQIS